MTIKEKIQEYIDYKGISVYRIMKAGMIGDVEFKKAGSETVCCVSLINTTAGQRFLACTLSSSKTFKTFKGAEKFMNSFGYQKI